MRKCFRDTMLRLASKDERLLLLLGDISVYLFKEFQEGHAERFFNIGICENTLVSMAGGLYREGFLPVVHTIAPFLSERSYEQVKLDLCYNGVGGTLVTCGGSFDYAWDGASHHCYTDLQLMCMLPRIEVMQPGSNKEFSQLLEARYASDCPSYLRIAADEHGLDLPVKFGKGHKILCHEAAQLTVITAGPLLKNVLAACEALPVNLLYFHTLKPLDCALLAEFSHSRMLVVHDAFGLFEAVAPHCAMSLRYHGIPDRFCGHYGTLEDIRGLLGLDIAGIRARIQEELQGA